MEGKETVASKYQKVLIILNQILQNKAALAHFDQNRETRLYTDASNEGVGGVLVQIDDKNKKHLIECAGRVLNETEKKYPTVEKEALAVSWSVKRFKYWLLGTKFAVFTDNEAVKFIFRKQSDGPTSKRAQTRADAYALSLSSYDCTFHQVAGDANVADVPSRFCTMENSEKPQGMDEEFEVEDLCVAALREIEYEAIAYENIKAEMEHDKTLEAVRHRLLTGLKSAETPEYEPHIKRLSTDGELVWYEDRVVLPENLRDQALMIAHSSHPGISSMKRRLRAHVWWPKVTEDAEATMKECEGCTAVAQATPPEPLRRTILPDMPWTCLAGDFFDMAGFSYLTMTCYFSRLLWVWQVRDKTAPTVLRCWEEALRRYGKWNSIKLDNGPPFQGEMVNDWLVKRKILLQRAVPLWPQSNGEIEIMHKALKRSLIATNETHKMKEPNRKLTAKEWDDIVQKYVYDYNNTPHSVTGIPPFELHFNRPMNHELPARREHMRRTTDNEELKERDAEAKHKGAMYADKRRHAKESSTDIGDQVRVEQIKTSKLTPRFGSENWTVTNKEGPKLTLQNTHGEQLIRASGATRKITSASEEGSKQGDNTADKESRKRKSETHDEEEPKRRRSSRVIKKIHNN